jgi:hypothetical protein
MPKILAAGLRVLREQARMPRLVNGDYSTEAAEKGDTIDVPVSKAVTSYDIAPTAHQATAADTTPGKVQIPLDNWRGAAFYLTDKDMKEIDRNRHFLPLQSQEAVRSLANDVNSDVMLEYKGIYGYTGTAGTTPFASTVTAAVNTRKVLNQQLCPRDSRRAVVDYDTEANMLALSQFSDVEKVGESAPKIEGEIGRKYGIDWYTDDDVKTHTNGTAWALGCTVGSTTAANASTLNIKSSSAGTALVGDVFTIAGDTQTYVVTASTNLTSAGVDVTIDPPLKAIATAADALTAKASHVVNLAFHREAFALAMRPLAGVTETNPYIMSMMDDQTGLTLRLEVTRQNKQDKWEFDVLWGAKLVEARMATRLAG